MEQFARVLILVGASLLIIGAGIYLASRLQLPIGRLPGDIVITRDNFTCFFPLATSIILSILLTIGLNLIGRLLNR